MIDGSIFMRAAKFTLRTYSENEIPNKCTCNSEFRILFCKKARNECHSIRRNALAEAAVVVAEAKVSVVVVA